MPNLNTGILERVPIVYPRELHIQERIVAVVSAFDDLIVANERRIALLERMAEEIYREWIVRLRFPGHGRMEITKRVPAGWSRRYFHEFCVLKRGYDLPDSRIQSGPYPVIASTSIKAWHAEFKVSPPVITTGRSGSLGDVLFVNTPAWPLNTSLYVRDFLGNSPYLVYFTLKFMELGNFNSGAGVPTLNRNHLNGITLAVPPMKLQAQFDAMVEPIFRQAEMLRRQVSALRTSRDTLLPRLISGKLSVEDVGIRFPPSMVAAKQCASELAENLAESEQIQ